MLTGLKIYILQTIHAYCLNVYFKNHNIIQRWDLIKFNSEGLETRKKYTNG